MILKMKMVVTMMKIKIKMMMMTKMMTMITMTTMTTMAMMKAVGTTQRGQLVTMMDYNVKNMCNVHAFEPTHT